MQSKLQYFTDWINSHDWTNAKSYEKKAPHEYLIRAKIPEEDGRIMVDFAHYIKEHGYTEYFYQTPFIYLNIQGYKYWTMDYPIYKTTLVNRCKIENKYGN